VSGDAPAVPSKEGVGGDELAITMWSGQCGGDCAEEGPVIVVEGWPVDLSAEHTKLVAQHDDLQLFAAPRANCEAGQSGDEAVQNSVHET
jgi:hypothetical protein